jgi:hypothetical protein
MLFDMLLFALICSLFAFYSLFICSIRAIWPIRPSFVIKALPANSMPEIPLQRSNSI